MNHAKSGTVHRISKAFQLVYFKDALVYYKEVGGGGAEGQTADIKEGVNKAMELLKQIRPAVTS